MPSVIVRVTMSGPTSSYYTPGVPFPVSMSCPTTGAVIYYTIDGTHPDPVLNTGSSIQYTASFLYTPTSGVIQFVANAFLTGWTSPVDSFLYMYNGSVTESGGVVTGGLMINLDSMNTASYPYIGTQQFSTPVDLTAAILLVGGGGAGGGNGGGGGGGGGVFYTASFVIPSGTWPVVVGSGGLGFYQYATWSKWISQPGGTSSFLSLSASGGGQGGSRDFNGWNPGNGGCGGGGGNSWLGPNYAFGTGTAGQGFNGGAGNYDAGQNNGNASGGGGGGAGQAGGAAATSTGSMSAKGGNGVQNSITGIATYYGGGGGGGRTLNNGPVLSGGLGGGGNGYGLVGAVTTAATSGQDGLGGGGGGGGGNFARGGSGCIIIRYPGAQVATGGTVITVGGDTVHIFSQSLGSSNLWLDMSPSGNNVQFLPMASGVARPPAGYLNFDGIGTAGWSYVNPSGLSGTMMAWVRWGATGFYPWVYATNSPTSSYTHEVTITSGKLLQGYLYDGAAKYVNGVSPVNLGAWYHVALVWKSGTALKLYLNGVLEATGNVIGTPTACNTIFFGYTNGGAYFTGSMGTFQIYNYDLSGSDILTNYSASKDVFYTEPVPPVTASAATVPTGTYTNYSHRPYERIANKKQTSGSIGSGKGIYTKTNPGTN